MKWIKRIVGTLLVLLLLAFLAGRLWFQSVVPQYEGEIALDGLSGEVKVVHDDYGIPHLYASNKKDAYKALGYLHAQERLWQMDLMRRVGGGKLSEILGEDLVEVDKLFRTLGTEKKAQEAAQRVFAEIDHESEELALAYIEGINHFVEHGATPAEYNILGIEKEPFSPVDMYRTVGYMSFSFALALREDPLASKVYEQLGPEYYADMGMHSDSNTSNIPVAKDSNTQEASMLIGMAQNAIDKLPIPLFTGSNSWVVAPERSESGKVLFCNDAHIEYAQPSVWWEAHIECPDFNLYGNYLAGFPFPLIGHTLTHSWGLTMFQNDDMDFYRETVENEQIMYLGEWTAIKSRTEEIRVKGTEQPVTVTVKETPHGPLINGVNDLLDEPTSIFWTFNHLPNNALKVTYGMSHAQNIEDFENTLSHHNAPGLNIMYGDSEGNIAWWATAKLPRRNPHIDPKRTLDGADSAHEINGYYEFSQNPHSVNPESGYVYSANNQPEGEYEGSLYPGYYYRGARGERITNFFAEQQKFNTNNMKEMLMDNQGLFHVRNMQALMPLVNADNKEQEQLKSNMLAWNGSHDQNQFEPTFYYAFQYNVLKAAMQDELGEEDFSTFLKTHIYMRTYHVLAQKETSPWWDNVHTDTEESKSDIVNTAFQQTVEQLSTKWGESFNDWTWNKAFQIEHPHALGKVDALAKIFNVGRLSINGGIEVLNKQGFVLNENLEYTAKTGPSKRIVIDFADVENAESINPTGQSGHVLSPHYSDQFEMHATGKFRPMLMDRDQLVQLERVLWFKPAEATN